MRYHLLPCQFLSAGWKGCEQRQLRLLNVFGVAGFRVFVPFLGIVPDGGSFSYRLEQEKTMTRDRERGATAERLRADIYSGRTGDKVAFPDPFAAPLGSDEEAGEMTIVEEAREKARQALGDQGRDLDDCRMRREFNAQNRAMHRRVLRSLAGQSQGRTR
jgi:hypothetical protein